MNKMLLIVLFSTLLALVGCNKGDSNTSSSDPTKDMTLTDAMNKLQERGELPVLDTTDTLAGIDADGDGIRDDIQGFINNLTVPDKQKQLFSEYAKAEQAIMLVDSTDKRAVKIAAENVMKSAVCLIRGQAPEQQDRLTKYSDQIAEYTSNTKIRFEQSHKFEAAYNGSVYRLPAEGECI